MTAIHGTLLGPGGGRPQAAAVTITLVDGQGQPVIGFTGDAEVIGGATPVVDADGTWTATLTPTGDITSPRGDTLYRVDERSATGRARYYISVPSSGTPWVGDLRVTLPGDAGEELAGYLPLAGGTLTGPLVLQDASPAASEAYVDAAGGGGGGTPSGTVAAETSYGQATAAGVATTYSRGDHTHGTPDLPTPGAIGAASSGHTHAGTYDPAGTAAAAVAAHEADTTAVHGIADTSALETTSGATAKVS
ncbi:hypothetical protein, partial [Sphaerisporangium sp. TRM90804]|uniref:hypothetical protein n=1 Tax=Sphaerisporangium sp. TRM90804 TaxID=3031113 RepID=UPI002448307B